MVLECRIYSALLEAGLRTVKEGRGWFAALRKIGESIPQKMARNSGTVNFSVSSDMTTRNLRRTLPNRIACRSTPEDLMKLHRPLVLNTKTTDPETQKVEIRHARLTIGRLVRRTAQISWNHIAPAPGCIYLIQLKTVERLQIRVDWNLTVLKIRIKILSELAC